MTQIEIPSASTRRRFPRRVLIVALLCMLTAFGVVLSGHSMGFLQRIEQGASDFRSALFSDRITSDHPDVVLISVGGNVSQSRATFDRRTIDVDRGHLARLIGLIDESAPRAIGIDIPLRGSGDPIVDEALQKVLREAKARVVIGVRNDGSAVTPERRAWINAFIAGTGRQAGHISSIYDDGQGRVVRVEEPRPTAGNQANSFALLMARALRPETIADRGPIAWLQRVDEDRWLTQYMSLGGQQPFRTLYGEEILDGHKSLPPRQLSGRLVLITTGLAEIERHRTPLTSWTGEALAPIQIQAQALAQMLDRRSVGEVAPHTLRLGLFTLACFAGLVGWYRGPGWHIPGTLFALAMLVMIDALVFSWREVALPIVPALIVWLLADVAGRSLRHINDWEELHGQPLPSEASPESEAMVAGQSGSRA
jgi:CHASE2 domain-containing sensor protein